MTAEEEFRAVFADIRLGSMGFGSPLAEGACLLTDGVTSLTISCSPSSFTPRFDSFAVSPYWLNDNGLGGYPYFNSKLEMDVFSVILFFRSSTVAVSDKDIAACPDGPRILILICTKK